MKNSIKLLMVGVVLISAFLGGCKKEDDPVIDYTADLVKIGTMTDNGVKIALYADTEIYNAYTKLYVELRDADSDALIEGAHVTLNPMMDMGTMMHSAPFENPASETAVNTLFPCAVVFQMPGEMGWTLEVTVHEHTNGREATVTFPISVMTATVARTHVVTPLDSTAPIIISWVQPSSPEVGMNDFEITIHQRETMMSFPGVTDYTVSIEPEMPSMGHGSPNNVNPTHGSDGHYNGQVNFTMTGLWRINLNIMDGSTPIDTTSYFEITFQ